jgi:hypothetical protein
MSLVASRHRMTVSHGTPRHTAAYRGIQHTLQLLPSVL